MAGSPRIPFDIGEHSFCICLSLAADWQRLARPFSIPTHSRFCSIFELVGSANLGSHRLEAAHMWEAKLLVQQLEDGRATLLDTFTRAGPSPPTLSPKSVLPLEGLLRASDTPTC